LGFGELGGWPDEAVTNNYYCSFFCRQVKKKYPCAPWESQAKNRGIPPESRKIRGLRG
jgi:hypothetical protein